MKANKYILALLFPFFLTPYLNAQDTLFKKYLSIKPDGVTYLGDQNGDGYDDFMLYDCNLQKAYIFFGGNPMDTIPKLQFTLPYASFITQDLNNDGKLDIIATYYSEASNNAKIRVYYGGSLLDTIPDLEFSGPTGSRGWGWPIYSLKNFTGDGHSELVVYDP